MYIKEGFKYTVMERTCNGSFQALWIELQFRNKTNAICGIPYQQHNSLEKFLNYVDSSPEKYSISAKPIYTLGDLNINLLEFETSRLANDFLLSLQSYSLTSVINKPTRAQNGSATLIDNILVNQVYRSIRSGNVSDISDRFSQFCLLPSPQLNTPL